MKIVICVPVLNYWLSNGILSLVHLCSELRARGLQASICALETRPDFSVMPLSKVLNSCERYMGNVVVQRTFGVLKNLVNDYNISFVETADININEDIVLYPETYPGNPLGAKRVVKYYGNREGYLVGNEPDNLNCFNLAHSVLTHDNPDHVLFFGNINENFLEKSDGYLNDRDVDLTYVGKGDLYVKNPAILPDTLELARFWPNKKKQLAYLLSKTRFFYTYDVFTQTNVDAVVCGAIPVFLIDKPYSDKEIDGGEYGVIPRVRFGQKIDESIFEVFRIERLNFLKRIISVVEKYPVELDNLIAKLQDRFGVIDLHNDNDCTNIEKSIKFLKFN